MRLKQVANSLVARMIVLGLLMAVFGTALSYYTLTEFLRQDLTRVVAAQQTALAEYAARDVDASLEERRKFLERLAAWLPRELLGQPGRLREWLRERHELQPLFSLGLLVADARGVVLADFPELAGRAGYSLAQDPRFPDALVKPWVGSSPRIGPVSGKPVLPMTTPVRDGQGHTVGVLIGLSEIAREGFLGRALLGRIGASGGILLVSPRDQLFIASSDPAMTLTPTPPPGRNALHDRAMAGFRGSGLTVNAKGVEDIAAIVSVPSTGWFVVARLPTSEAFATVSRVQAFIVGWRLLAMLVVLALIGAIVVWLLRPLYRAAEQADRMTLGSAPLAPLEVVRDDEVGHLTTAFNRLLAKLGENQQELARMAHHDELTGLPNRKLLADRMALAMARARRHSTQIAVLFMDLNGFKLINDTLGHDAGDEALKEVAQRLSGVLRRSDTLARLGGDEFVLLATDLDGAPEVGARSLAQKCIDVVARPLRLRGIEHRIGVSIGVTLSTGAGSTEALLMAADKAMYDVKQTGAGGFRVVSPSD